MIKMKAPLARALMAGAAGGAMMWTGQAQAQTVAPDESLQLEAVVVTALKRETNLQDTPLSISAVSGQTLEKMGASTVLDMVRSVPGLNLTEGNTGQRRITVRGVQSAGESTVGLYLGETPVSGPNSATSDPSSITPDLNMFDVQRVEVLRGPQGTLYGSGSMSGTLKVIFNEPNASRYEGAFDGSVSSTKSGGDSYALRGMVNLPLVEDKLAARLVLYDELRGGYVDNPRLKQTDINEVRAYGGRFMLGFKPTASLTINGSVNLQEQRVEDSGLWYPAIGRYQADNYHKLPFPNSFRLYNLKADWDLGFAVLTATSSKYDWKSTKYIDGTRGALSVLTPATYCARYLGISGTCSEAQKNTYRAYVNSLLPLSGWQPMIVDTWVHEARLSSTGDRRLSWTVGAFLEKRDDWSQSSTVEADGVTGVVLQPIVYNFARTVAIDLEQKALFGEVTYKIIPDLAVTVGLRRYSYDKTSESQVLMTSYINASVAGPKTTYDSDAKGWVSKVNVSYQVTPDIMVYAQRSEGFRPGGINNTPGLTPDLIPYTSDELVNYEAGIKTAWFDGRYTLNASAYQIDWTDMQISARIPNFSFITNVGASKIRGLEIEGAARPMQGLTLTGNLNFVHGELEEDQVNGIIEAPGRKGDRIPYEPSFTTAVSAEYAWPIADGFNGVVRLDYSYTGKSYSEFRPTSTTYEAMGDYSNLNLRGGVEGDGWGAYLFANNLTDEVGKIKVSSGTLSEQATLSTTPRTVGLNLRKRF
jgi:outer membrane receptor protein involved in Fe transport